MDEASARDAASAFSLGAMVGEPRYVARGAMGEVWRVDTTRGRWAIKALFEWADYPDRPLDVDVQLAAAGAGVRLPLPVLVGDRAVIDIAGRGFRAYEWVELGPRLNAPVPPATAADAGTMLGLIHSLCLAVSPEGADAGQVVDGWYLAPPEQGRLSELAGRAARDARAWAQPLADALPMLADLAESVAGDHGVPAVCHRDFSLDNVRPLAGGGQLVVLDWENVGPLAADEELAGALVEVAVGRQTVAADTVEAFVAGYQGAGGGARLRGAASFAMTVNTALNYVCVLAEQALDDPQHRAFAEATLADVLGRFLPPLPAAIPVIVRSASSAGS